MSLGAEYLAETQFERDFPFGIPSNVWRTKDGRKIPIVKMTDSHIKNCMRIVGEDDGWYWVFQKELNRRSNI